MADIVELEQGAYSDLDVIQHLTLTCNALHRIGVTIKELTDNDRLYLQYAHDVLKSIRNANIDAQNASLSQSSRIIV